MEVSHVCEVDYIDFEKVFFGLEQFLRQFKLGEYRKVIADFDPGKRSVRIEYFVSDEHGGIKSGLTANVCRIDCERFLMFIGKKYIDSFEPEKKQRIIIEYDPQNEKASIGIQSDSEMHSSGSSGTNEGSVSGSST